jgi:unspecific monooxygenase
MSRDLLGALRTWQQTHGDLVHLRIWPEHEVLVSDPALVRELLVTRHDDLLRWERGMRAFRRVQGDTVLTTEGETWRAKRQAVQPSMSPKAVQSFTNTITEAATQALAGWPSHHEAWPVESAFTSLAMDVILRLMFSHPAGEDTGAVEAAVHTVLAATNAEMFWPASWPDWMPWKRNKYRALRLLKGMVQRHLQQRLASDEAVWPDDLLTRLLRLHRCDGGRWSLEAVRDECITTFLAGHETVAATLTWWAWCMAAHPQVQARAQEEVAQVLRGAPPSTEHLPRLRWLTATLQETLRLYPAAPMLFTRRSTRPVQLGPWHFPARTMFIVPVQGLHHDPRWFTEPESFRPERFADGAEPPPRGAYLPFGAGPRVCVGQHLAMAELTIVTALLLQRRALHVPERAAPPRPVLQISLRPAQPLHIALQPIAALA